MDGFLPLLYNKMETHTSRVNIILYIRYNQLLVKVIFCFNLVGSVSRHFVICFVNKKFRNCTKNTHSIAAYIPTVVLGPHLRTPELRVTPGSIPRNYYITEGV
jgi:hypothetical protein